MNVGILASPATSAIDIAFTAKTTEELGFDSIWCAEHPVIPVHYSTPYPGSSDGVIPDNYHHIVDPFIFLARASGVTRSIKLGTGVCLIPERNPLLLAKIVSTLDYFSGGRFIFGIGTGWLREQIEIMGGNFEHRWNQTKESLEAMKVLWTDAAAEYHGQYINFPAVKSFPKPIQKPHPPILIGGSAKNVFKRIVDHGDGWLPNRATPDDIARAKTTISDLCKHTGRDPSTISITVFHIFGPPDNSRLINAFFAAGADRVVVRPKDVETEDEMFTELHRLATLLLK